jgi:hypothetical protein
MVVRRSGKWPAVLALFVATTVQAAPDPAPRLPVRAPDDPIRAGDRATGCLRALMIGASVKQGPFAFVALHARTPREARRSGAFLPQWAGEQAAVSRPAPGTLRVRAGDERPLLVFPGQAWTLGKEHWRALEWSLVPSGAARYVRAASGSVAARLGVGWLAPGPTAELLEDPSRAVAADVHLWNELARDADFRRCERATRPWEQSGDGTLVGCVALVGGEPVVGFAFGDAPLLREVRRDLLAATVLAARAQAERGIPRALQRLRADRSDPRHRVRQLIREFCRGERRTRDVPGGGLRWAAGAGSRGHRARALLDADGRLVAFGCWRLPDRPSESGAKPAAPPPQDSESDEDRRLRERRRLRPQAPGIEPPRLPKLPSGG